MPDTTERDLVELVEQLLAKATPGPFDVYPIKTLKGDITGFTWGKYLSDRRDADHFWSSELVPFDDAQLYSRSYELLRRLVEEVKLWKEQTESLVAAFDRDDYGDEEVVRITREAALNVAKEELGWPK